MSATNWTSSIDLQHNKLNSEKNCHTHTEGMGELAPSSVSCFHSLNSCASWTYFSVCFNHPVRASNKKKIDCHVQEDINGMEEWARTLPMHTFECLHKNQWKQATRTTGNGMCPSRWSVMMMSKRTIGEPCLIKHERTDGWSTMGRRLTSNDN